MSGIADRLQILIDKTGKSVYQIVKESGVDKAAISRILNGVTSKMHVDNIKILSDYFHVDPVWLQTGNASSTTQGPPPAPVPPEYIQITDERIRALENRVTYLEGQISILLRKEIPEKHDSGGRDENQGRTG